MTAADAPRLRIARDGSVACVTLDRPDKRNAIDLAACIALRETFEALAADPDLRVVLLDAAGPVFCAGADLAERAGRDAAWVLARRKAAFAAYEAIETCAVPVVALVQGAAIGSGGEIALACDFILAASDASFRFPEPQWGTVGATQRLQRAIGPRGAKELLFTGRAMPAQEALARGLVARIVPPADLPSAGRAVAAGIAKAPPRAMRLTKQAVDLGGRTDLSNGIRIELAAIARMLEGEEWRDGLARFAGRQAAGQGTDPD